MNEIIKLIEKPGSVDFNQIKIDLNSFARGNLPKILN